MLFSYKTMTQKEALGCVGRKKPTTKNHAMRNTPDSSEYPTERLLENFYSLLLISKKAGEE